MLNRIVLLLALLLMSTLCIAGYQWARAAAAKDIYHERLGQLQSEYRDLADQYNRAVTPKPVTELLVEDGKVSVIIRDGDGKVRTIPTEAHGSRAVYVDYAVIDGRLLIRRVFDEETAPKYATYIDDDLVQVDWDDPLADFGQAIYSTLDDGRWIISVTSNGALYLKRIENDASYDLVSRPGVREFDPVEVETADSAQSIGIGDVWRHLFGG